MIAPIDRRALLDAMRRTKDANEEILQHDPTNISAHARIAVLNGYISLIESGFFDLEGSFL